MPDYFFKYRRIGQLLDITYVISSVREVIRNIIIPGETHVFSYQESDFPHVVIPHSTVHFQP